MCELGVKLYSIERQLELFKKTNKFLPKLGYRPKKLIFGDGYKGLEEESPFDGIIVTAAPEHIPAPLLNQLKVGGIVVLPVGNFFQQLQVNMQPL